MGSGVKAPNRCLEKFLTFLENNRRAPLIWTHLRHSIALLSWNEDGFCFQWIADQLMPDSFIREVEKHLYNFSGVYERAVCVRGITIQGQSLSDQDKQRFETVQKKALDHPIIQKVYKLFPGAVLEQIDKV